MSTYDLFACFAAFCVLIVICVAFYDDYQYRKQMRQLHRELWDDEQDDE